jgi:hypothetical protein
MVWVERPDDVPGIEVTERALVQADEAVGRVDIEDALTHFTDAVRALTAVDELRRAAMTCHPRARRTARRARAVTPIGSATRHARRYAAALAQRKLKVCQSSSSRRWSYDSGEDDSARDPLMWEPEAPAGGPSMASARCVPETLRLRATASGPMRA